MFIDLNGIPYNRLNWRYISSGTVFDVRLQLKHERQHASYDNITNDVWGC
jgi:hypothetical protein